MRIEVQLYALVANDIYRLIGLMYHILVLCDWEKFRVMFLKCGFVVKNRWLRLFKCSKTIRRLIILLRTKYVFVLKKLYFFSEENLFARKYFCHSVYKIIL